MFSASSDFSALNTWIRPLNVSLAGVSPQLGHLSPWYIVLQFRQDFSFDAIYLPKKPRFLVASTSFNLIDFIVFIS